MSNQKTPKKKVHETLIVAGFDTDQESSVFYRKYKKKCSVSNVVLKLLSTHAVDMISIRVVNRRKQLKLDKFIEDQPQAFGVSGKPIPIPVIEEEE